MERQSKYNSEEILEYFKADYTQRAAFDIAVEKGQELKFADSKKLWGIVSVPV